MPGVDRAARAGRVLTPRTVIGAILGLLALAWLSGAALDPPPAALPAPQLDPATASAPPAAPVAVPSSAPAPLEAAAASAAPSPPAALDAAAAPAAPLDAAAASSAPPAAAPTSPALPLALLRGAQPGADGRLTARLPDGRVATLSLDPVLQRRLTQLLEDYEVPYAAIVAIEPKTGRLLAVAEHSSAEPGRAAGLASTPFSPAASVFKVVTAAALLEEGVSPQRRVCYHGGKSRLSPKLLKDGPGDNRCVTFSEAMARSANVAFAKLAAQELTPARLQEQASRLLFGRPLQLEGGATLPSPAPIPTEPFAFANAAAGFSAQVRLTPLHGALLAGVVGNHGVLSQPRLVDEIDGVPVESAPAERLLSPEVARELTAMMTRTVSEGTARRAFRERRKAALPGIGVAGKTGSLDEQRPFRDHTWFVGFAPAQAPTIAVAAVIVNDPRWRIRASYAAREALRTFLLGTTPYRPPRKEPAPVAAQ